MSVSINSPTFLMLCFRWLIRKEQMAMLIVISLVFVSSLGVIYSSFLTRKQYAELQELQKQEDELDGEYGKLLLEYSAWASYMRVEKVSKERLDMVTPEIEEMILVAEK